MQTPFANMPPVVKNLLIINILCFLPLLVFNQELVSKLYTIVAAHYFDAPDFKVWQPISYMFFHGGPGDFSGSIAHIFFNMFALFSFGTAIEYAMGSKRFFNFYFICGLGGIALQTLIQAFEVHSITGSFTIPNADQIQTYYLLGGDKAQQLYDVYHTSMVGASGAIFGVLVAFVMLFPDVELMIMFIPIPIKAKYLVPGYIALELFLGFKQFAGDPVAHFAHLGGALIGFILVKAWGLKRNKWY